MDDIKVIKRNGIIIHHRTRLGPVKRYVDSLAMNLSKSYELKLDECVKGYTAELLPYCRAGYKLPERMNKDVVTILEQLK